MSGDEKLRNLGDGSVSDEELRALGEEPLSTEERSRLSTPTSQGDPLSSTGAFLLRAQAHLEFSKTQHARGRGRLLEDLSGYEQRTGAGRKSRNSRRFWRRGWFLLPLPALAALGLFLVFDARRAEETGVAAVSQEPASGKAPELELARAQLAMVQARLLGPESNESRLEAKPKEIAKQHQQATARYRAVLLASLAREVR